MTDSDQIVVPMKVSDFVRHPDLLEPDHAMGCEWYWWGRCNCGPGIVRDVSRRFDDQLRTIMGTRS